MPMLQADLFAESPPANAATTAIYPNRIRDKTRLEHELGLLEFGDPETVFLTPAGTCFAVGYVRICYGDHGPYVEFNREQIRAPLKRKFNRPPPPEAYYDWLEPVDGSGVKVYDQKRDVKHIRNAPAGGYAGNRAEGYADYKPGMIYVSPYELVLPRARIAPAAHQGCAA